MARYGATAGIFLATLKDLAKTLGCSLHQLDCVKEERSARAAIDRRGFFKAVGAVAAGVCMSLPLAEPVLVGGVYTWADIEIRIIDCALHYFESVSELSVDLEKKTISGTARLAPFGYFKVKA